MPAKVLVVDDSALMRKHLTQLFLGAGFEVILARDGKEAVQRVVQDQPDVVTLDVNMPEMDGLSALSLILSARPTPVVMVSSLTTKGALATLEALAMGAVDFVAKPGGTISLSISEISAELVSKVRTAARARVRSRRGSAAELRQQAPGTDPAARAPAPPRGEEPGLVLIGVSTGGPATLEEILPELPAEFPWPVLVAQHMPPSFTATLAARLGAMCSLAVEEVAAPREIRRGSVYVAKGGTDLVVSRRAGRLVALPRPESPHHLWHPSVELLVESALGHVAPERLIAVQLTGMGEDGAEAMARLHSAGGRTIAESEESAVVFGMPRALIERRGASAVLPAERIARQLVQWVM